MSMRMKVTKYTNFLSLLMHAKKILPSSQCAIQDQLFSRSFYDFFLRLKSSKIIQAAQEADLYAELRIDWNAPLNSKVAFHPCRPYIKIVKKRIWRVIKISFFTMYIINVVICYFLEILRSPPPKVRKHCFVN